MRWWALGARGRTGSPLRVKALWWSVIAAESTIAVQVILGVVLVAGQGIDAPEFHVLRFRRPHIGGALYSHRTQIKPRLYLLYGFGSLFLMGLAIRAMLLG
ncbi:MAG: hypothetical protein R2789_03000 [Microthrixaceae bacterium]